jgi:hypothetical protein
MHVVRQEKIQQRRRLLASAARLKREAHRKPQQRAVERAPWEAKPLTKAHMYSLMQDPEFVSRANMDKVANTSPEKMPCLPWGKATLLDEWCVPFAY